MATSDNILIQVSGLKKHYNKGAIKALDGVDIDIHRGEVVVVIGPSGSGKSTFLRSLNLMEEPTGGEIIFNGVDITKKKIRNEEGKMVKLNIDEHRQKMGMVFQHFNLFPHMTILDNMTLAPIQVKGVKKEDAEKRALALLDRVGLGDRANAIPFSSPAVRSSAWPLFAPCAWSPKSCCLTSLPPPWTPKWSARCSTSCSSWRRPA